jgi:clan AA aspartic protease (TIGR02281 family)
LQRAIERGALEGIERSRLDELDALLLESYLGEIGRLREAGQLDAAADVASAAVERFARSRALWSELGGIFAAQGLLRDAIAAFLEVRALHLEVGATQDSARVTPILEELYQRLAAEALRRDDGRQAELVYLEGITQLADSAVLRLELGRLYQRWAAYEDAVRVLQEAKRLDRTLGEQVDILLEKIEETLARRDAIVIPIPAGSSSIRAKAVVDEHLEVPFVIDTGATYTSISDRLARELGYDPDRAPVTIVNTAAGQLRVNVIKVESVSLQGYSVRNLDVLVLPATGGREVNLLGLNFLNFFRYSVDSKRREFRLERQ